MIWLTALSPVYKIPLGQQVMKFQSFLLYILSNPFPLNCRKQLARSLLKIFDVYTLPLVFTQQIVIAQKTLTKLEAHLHLIPVRLGCLGKTEKLFTMKPK